MRRNSFSSVLALLLTSPLAAASTWVVDANGGPGVDFTDIGAAEAASVPGDVILVMPGSYPGFTVDIAISILGQTGGRVITGDVLVSSIPAGGRTTLAGLTTAKVKLIDCSSPVTLEDLVAAPAFAVQLYGSVIEVRSCTDVRLRNVEAYASSQGTIHALTVTSARVEVTHSVLKGSYGHSHDIYTFLSPPEDGGDGLRVLGASSNVHVSSSQVRGGGGGGLPKMNLCTSCVSGDGGAGIRISLGHGLVTGPASAVVIGGDGGEGNNCNEDGMPGTGISVAAGATLAWSGASVQSAQSPFGCIPFLEPITGPYTEVIPADPTLRVSGSASAGQSVTFRFTGEPGAHAILNIGRHLTLTDLPNAAEDELTFPLRNISLGMLPASGEATYVFTLPPSASKGTLLVFQGRTISTGGALALTQSLPITLR
jgi:hypothetical protein